MIEFANPIYDVTFRFLLEDKKITTSLLSAIIGETIEELEFSATEHTVRVERKGKKKAEKKDTDERTVDDHLTVCRMDFSAKIKTDCGYKTVAIELQKAKFGDDIMRFRQYLGTHYENATNAYAEGDKEKARQIYTIYFLNYDIGVPDCPVIAVDYSAKDAATGKTVEAENEFIKGLHHKSWVVQMKQLKEHRRNQLERMLDVFGEGAAQDTTPILKVSKEDVPEECEAIFRRLVYARADEKLCGAMALEDQIIEELRRNERREAEKDKVIEEKEKVIEEKEKVIEVLMQEKDESKAALEAKDAALEAQAREIAELRKLVAHTQNPSK